jgi:hypothetical protein
MLYLGSGEDDLPAHKYQENNPENMKRSQISEEQS